MATLLPIEKKFSKKSFYQLPTMFKCLLSKGEYDGAWYDVHKAQSLGYSVSPGFLKTLRETVGRRR